MAELGGLALSYAAGALSTLSPCVLPLLPIILFGVLEQHAWGPVAMGRRLVCVVRRRRHIPRLARLQHGH